MQVPSPLQQVVQLFVAAGQVAELPVQFDPFKQLSGSGARHCVLEDAYVVTQLVPLQL